MAFQYLQGAYKRDVDKLFSRTSYDRTRGFKVREGLFRDKEGFLQWGW